MYTKIYLLTKAIAALRYNKHTYKTLLDKRGSFYYTHTNIKFVKHEHTIKLGIHKISMRAKYIVTEYYFSVVYAGYNNDCVMYIR